MPVLRPGFYATREAPLEAFDCRNVYRCPGGNEPAWDYDSTVKPMCVPHAGKLNCGKCDDGYYLTGGSTKCEKCSGINTLMFFLLLILLFVIFISVYMIANSPLTVEMSPLLSASISLGVTISMLQTLGMVASLALEWPSPIREIMAFLKVLVFDLQEFGIDCTFGVSSRALEGVWNRLHIRGKLTFRG